MIKQNRVFAYADLQLITVICSLTVLSRIGADILTHKIFSIGHFSGSAALIVFPLAYLLSDMVTELYGVKFSRYFFYCTLIVEGLFALVVSQLIYLPSPTNFFNQDAFEVVLSPLPRIYIGALIALLISALFNIQLMHYLKEQFSGRHYFFRTMLASLAGELLFTVIGYVIWFYGLKPWSMIFELIAVSLLSKVVFTTGFAFVISTLIEWVKQRPAYNVIHAS